MCCRTAICWLTQRVFPHFSGYGDLWEDIQNVQEKDRDGIVPGQGMSNEEAEGRKTKKEENEIWRKNEESENWNDEFSDKNGEIRGMTQQNQKSRRDVCMR